MKEIRIDYKTKGFLRILSLLVATSSATLTAFLCIMEVSSANYGILFFCTLAIFILSLTLILSLTVFQAKPLIILNSTGFVANIKGQKATIIQWSDVKEVGIGLSSLRFRTNSTKQSQIEIGALRYDDLRKLKNKLIELCESKEIAFHND